MSVELLSARESTPDKDTLNKKVSQSEEDILAQYSKELDFDADSIEAEEEQKATEARQLAKLAELNEHLEDADDRRRGLKAIYNSELADSMTNEEVEAFIAERLAPSSATPAELEAPITPETEKTAEKTTGAPEGFPTKEEYLEDLKTEGPVKLGFWKKARLLAGAPGRAIWKGYSKLFESAARRSEKFNAMTPEQQERLKKKTAIISTLSALAIGGAYFATKSEQIRDLLPGHDVKGNAVPAGPLEVSDPKEHQGGESAVNTLAEQQRVHEAQFIYTPEADPFNNPDKKEWNFGAALDTSSVEAATADLTEGWKHNPLQFATVMGSFGMIPNNQASIESMAQQMLDSPSLFATNHAAAMDIVNSSNARFVEGSYNAHGSYSMVANPNGAQSLIYDPSVVDPQMMLVMDTPNGAVATGCNCRQISEIAAAPAPAPAHVESAPATGGASYLWQPERPTGGYTPPPKTYTPPPQTYTPPPETYTPPPETYTPPPETETPPPETYTPPEQKTNKYPANEYVAPRGPGVFMPTPEPVETETVTIPSRDIGGGAVQEPIVDKITAPRNSETGGQMTEGTKPSLDTSPNTSGPAKVQKSESTTTNTAEVESSL